MKYIYHNGKIFSKLQLHFKGFEIKREIFHKSINLIYWYF